MKLVETDSSLSAVCRDVEQRLQDIVDLESLELHVELLPNFDTKFPQHRLDPGLYLHSGKTIYINGATVSDHICEAVLTHEIAHAAFEHTLLDSRDYECYGNTDIVADLSACKWGFYEEIKADRRRVYGDIYCEVLDPSIDNNERCQRLMIYRLHSRVPQVRPQLANLGQFPA
jgi:hypothetical protein